MKVRVTEGVLQECCQKLSQSAEQVDQPLEEVGNVDEASLKECLQENEQLNEELENLLTTICNQKRVIPSVCLLYPFHSQNLQSQLHIQPIDLATMLEQLRTPSLFISFADILGYLKKTRNHFILTNRFSFFLSFIINRISPMVQEQTISTPITTQSFFFFQFIHTDPLPLPSKCE